MIRFSLIRMPGNLAGPDGLVSQVDPDAEDVRRLADRQDGPLCSTLILRHRSGSFILHAVYNRY
jgi:hypothetical protein